MLGPASAALARFDGVLQAVPNSMILLSPLSTREAVLSSRIEGTQATMGEVLRYEAGPGVVKLTPSKAADVTEIINYREALAGAEKQLLKLPLSNRLIKAAHATLLRGVRGENKTPGEFRRIQNWIAKPGIKMNEARFVPIQPQALLDGMSAWEKFIHAEMKDVLVQLAIVHAEFEALHPFLDGNGRVGRMLIPLFLYEKKALSRPVFYMSEWLEEHRDEYFERLLAVSRDDDWTGWCEFFLHGIQEQATRNCQKAVGILKLYKNKIESVADSTRSHTAGRALEFLFGNPIFVASECVIHTKISLPTTKRILKVLSKNKMLKVIRASKGRMGNVYVFTELLNLVEGRKVF